MKRIALSAAVASLAMIGAAQGQTIATANTSLNIRSGPGPEHPIIGSMGPNRRAMIVGCIEGSLWCQVNFRGLQGWAYSQYMTLNPGTTREVVVTDTAPLVTSMVPTATYSAPAHRDAYAYGGPVYSAPPYSAPVVNAEIDVARGAYAMAPGATITVTPPPAVSTYVTNNPLTPITWPGDVVVGAGLPRTVALQPVPDYRYQYVYVNDQPVLVDPLTRRIVYVFP